MIRNLLRWVHPLLMILLLASAFLPYLNPGRYWISGFAGIFFPLLFLLSLLSVPCWLFIKKRYALYMLGAILLCAKPALKTWAIHPIPADEVTKQPGSKQFTVMTYNTSSMGLANYKTNIPVQSAVYKTIATANPDILCLQEFYTNDHPDQSHNVDSLRLIGKYPYHYFTCDWVNWNTWYYGIILFSRYPVAAASTIPCNGNAVGSGRSFLQADVVVQGDTIRIFTVQLTSYMFNSDDYQSIRSLRSAGIAVKMKHTFGVRSEQALQLAGLVAQSPYPVIVCGDFNDTPASYTYHTISEGLQDAFLETGYGWGRTLSYLSPTLRIDYVLPQHAFRIHSCRVFHPSSSEHFPVMACLSLKKH